MKEVTVGKTNVYKAAGFTLLNKLDESGLRQYLCDTDDIKKGDALHDDGTGYATNAITAFANTFMGIAARDVDNSGGSKGDKNVLVIPPLSGYQFIVPVEADAKIAQTNVGTIVDLESVNTVDISDVTGAANAKGLFIDEIDISAAAIAVNTYGYAIGHFVAHTA